MPPLVILSETIFGKIVSTFDSEVYRLISAYISDDMTRFMKFVTFWGSGWALTIISLVILFIAFIRAKKKYFLCSLMVPVNLAAASLLDFILKQLFQRSRPDLLRLIEISGYSFPSGHSMSSISFYGFLIYLSIKYFKHWFKYSIVGALSLLVLAIGISRIYLGVHYASDVLGGFITGLGWLVLFIRLSRKALVFILHSYRSNPG